MFNMDHEKRKIAYFSMEIALNSDIPTYSGGLGVLAGDTLRSCADLEIPVVGVTLIYDKGYFYQQISPDGYQVERGIQWQFSNEFEKAPKIIELKVQEKTFKVGAWLYKVVGETGFEVPVVLLDTNIEGNEDWQKNFTHILYDATPFQRVVQEMILGIGGIKMLDALGFTDIQTYHMNEGHAAFLVFELLERKKSLEEVKKHCIFTTHTPVPAGHDRFHYDLIGDIFRDRLPKDVRQFAGENELNMSVLALNGSRYCNGVAQMHGEVSRKMFPGYEIDAITNGIHPRTWINPFLKTLLDDRLPGWTMNYHLLENIWDIGNNEIWEAHRRAKRELVDYEKSHSWVLLDRKRLTIGFARRITEYKRPTLMFTDLERLGKICKGKVQFIFAGKSHPRDNVGKGFIKQINDLSDYLYNSFDIGLVFLPAYDMDLSHLLVSGVDVWLNNPRRYLEASGTSGMKATLNGVLNLSVLDGWWIEGYAKDPMAGWAIGPGRNDPNATSYPDSHDANDLYQKLEREVIPLYFNNRDGWTERMKHAINIGAYFNTHRMVQEYAERGWKLKAQPRWHSF
jgi:starch phosphorylase